MTLPLFLCIVRLSSKNQSLAGDSTRAFLRQVFDVVSILYFISMISVAISPDT